MSLVAVVVERARRRGRRVWRSIVWLWRIFSLVK